MKPFAFLGTPVGGPPPTLPRSFAMTADNQNGKSQTNPTNLSYYNGSVDLDFCMSFDIKYISNGNLQFIHTISNALGTLTCTHSRVNADGTLSFFIGDHTGAGYFFRTTDTPITAGVWNRVVIYYLAADHAAVFSVNAGVITSTPSSPSYTHQPVIDNTFSLYVGNDPGNTYPMTNGSRIDNLTFYSSILSGGEVVELNALAGGDPTATSFAAKIKSCYKFNNNLTDSGPNAYTLTSVATPAYNADIP